MNMIFFEKKMDDFVGLRCFSEILVNWVSTFFRLDKFKEVVFLNSSKLSGKRVINLWVRFIQVNRVEKFFLCCLM